MNVYWLVFIENFRVLIYKDLVEKKWQTHATTAKTYNRNDDSL